MSLGAASGGAGRLIAIVGAESTGKTWLAQALSQRLAVQGWRATWVPETLREFCDLHCRTPHAHEQAQIAAQQTDRIEQARERHALVVADTTALMTAVYSEMVFSDRSLYPQALADHARADITLLTALDLAWKADGLQRDGPHVREPVDALLRHALVRAQLPFAVVGGQGDARLEQAWQAVAHLLSEPERQQEAARSPRWRWVCAHCGDGECEQHPQPLLTRG